MLYTIGGGALLLFGKFLTKNMILSYVLNEFKTMLLRPKDYPFVATFDLSYYHWGQLKKAANCK